MLVVGCWSPARLGETMGAGGRDLMSKIMVAAQVKRVEGVARGVLETFWV